MKWNKLHSLNEILNGIKDIKIITPTQEIKSKVDYKYIIEFRTNDYTIQAKVNDVDTAGFDSMSWDMDEEVQPVITDIKSTRVLCNDNKLYENIERICEYIMSSYSLGEYDTSHFNLPREYICLIDLIHISVLLTCFHGLPTTTELVMLQAYESGLYQIDELLKFTDAVNNLLYKFERTEMSVLTYNQDYDNPDEIREMLLAYDTVKDSMETYLDTFDIDNVNLKTFIRSMLTEIYCTQDLYKILTPEQYLQEIDKDYQNNKDETTTEPLTFFTNALRSIMVKYDI